MKRKILIVDDDERINEMLQDVFTMENYDVIGALGGEEAIRILESDSNIDVVILDIMMPKIDGWEMLAYIKSHYSVKVIMLTALSEEGDEVRGIRSGADDYVTKPFKRAVLVERVRRLVDSGRDNRSSCLVSDELVVNQQECYVTLHGERLHMTGKEFNFLLHLMKNPNTVLSRESILDKVWGFKYEGNDRTIDTHVKMLRHKLGDYGQKIRTIRGMGYIFDGKVVEK
ncbi:MAG: response regulator transcription factor [Oscillospiraceae bacterium]|nr:response regulator transcription factor [Oscillospiraceae bacterium]MDD6146690.1 response regulator transcription factor [Oscillospiraceae bacterium]